MPKANYLITSLTSRSGSLQLDLEMTEPAVITDIDIGNAGSASVTIKVGLTSWPKDRPLVLLAEKTLMTTQESRLWTPAKVNSVHMLSGDDFKSSVADEVWDRVSLHLSQPLSSAPQFGLAFLKIMVRNPSFPQLNSDLSCSTLTEIENTTASNHNKRKSLSQDGSLASNIVSRGEKCLLQSLYPKFADKKKKRVSPYFQGSSARSSLEENVEETIEEQVEQLNEENSFEVEVDKYFEAFDFSPYELETLKVSVLRELFEGHRGKPITDCEKKVFKTKAVAHGQFLLQQREEKRQRREEIMTTAAAPNEGMEVLSIFGAHSDKGISDQPKRYSSAEEYLKIVEEGKKRIKLISGASRRRRADVPKQLVIDGVETDPSDVDVGLFEEPPSHLSFQRRSQRTSKDSAETVKRKEALKQVVKRRNELRKSDDLTQTKRITKASALKNRNELALEDVPDAVDSEEDTGQIETPLSSKKRPIRENGAQQHSTSRTKRAPQIQLSGAHVLSDSEGGMDDDTRPAIGESLSTSAPRDKPGATSESPFLSVFDRLLQEESSSLECPTCSKLFPKTRIDAHAWSCQGVSEADTQEALCSSSRVACPLCDEMFPASVIERHAETCPDQNPERFI